jgi:hypothetical protein
LKSKYGGVDYQRNDPCIYSMLLLFTEKMQITKHKELLFKITIEVKFKRSETPVLCENMRSEKLIGLVVWSVSVAILEKSAFTPQQHRKVTS